MYWIEPYFNVLTSEFFLQNDFFYLILSNAAWHSLSNSIVCVYLETACDFAVGHWRMYVSYTGNEICGKYEKFLKNFNKVLHRSDRRFSYPQTTKEIVVILFVYKFSSETRDTFSFYSSSYISMWNSTYQIYEWESGRIALEWNVEFPWKIFCSNSSFYRAREISKIFSIRFMFQILVKR